MTNASAFSSLFVPVADVIVASIVLRGFSASMGQAGVARSDRRRILAVSTVGVGAWYLTVSYLAAEGVFLATPQLRFPMLPIAVFLPVIAGLVILWRSRFATRVLDATALSSLIAVQVLRVLGFVFLVEWALGSLPSVFALPAALGDIATGVLAIPVAQLAARNAPRATLFILLWNALGLCDFVAALTTGFLSSPGRFQMLALDHPNLIASAYPLVLVPVFGVPIFIMLHLLTLRKMQRETTQPFSVRTLSRST